MAKEPEFCFLFYPGEYLRDTQCLPESAQVAYDRIMSEHMRNMCISYKQFKFFTKRLSDSDVEDLLHIMVEVEGGYKIAWVAKSIEKRIAYCDSRSKNKEGKTKKICKSYDTHMVIVKEKVIVNKDKVKYLNNVLLTEEEFQSLLAKTFNNHGDLLERAIEKLDAYIPNKKGTPYKCHASAIRSWVADKVIKEAKEQNSGGHKGAMEFIAESEGK